MRSHHGCEPPRSESQDVWWMGVKDRREYYWFCPQTDLQFDRDLFARPTIPNFHLYDAEDRILHSVGALGQGQKYSDRANCILHVTVAVPIMFFVVTRLSSTTNWWYDICYQREGACRNPPMVDASIFSNIGQSHSINPIDKYRSSRAIAGFCPTLKVGHLIRSTRL